MGFLLLVFSLPAFAVLGGDTTSVQTDQAHLRASLSVTHASSYSMHELRTPTGQVVHEFVAPSGKVFAVAWHGPFHPDLKQLLGSHFEAYRQALQQRGTAHGPVTVQLPGLIVQLGGHMRDFVGRAYLTDEMPSDVQAKDIH